MCIEVEKKETQLPCLTHAYSMLTSFADLDIFNMTLV